MIEAIEANNDEYDILGIQWHPEVTFTTNQASLSIFEDLVTRAAAAREGG